MRKRISFKRKLLFRGTATALVTPFNADASLDEVRLRELVNMQIKSGVEALVPVGSTGEGATLSEREQARVIHVVADETNGRIPVLAGATSNDTARAVILSKNARSNGADAILSAAPYYNKPTQEGIYRHFRTIAEAVGIPVVIYNVPGRTASNIDAATAIRLAKDVPLIAGVKEASANLPQMMEILLQRPEGFGVWSGDDNLTLPLVALGADGVISVVANEIPKEFSSMVRLALKGKLDQARDLHFAYLSLMDFNFIESNPIPVKAMLARMGLIGETCRLPLVPLSEAARPVLEKVFKDLKLA